MAIDGGTESLRVGIFDCEGNKLATAKARYQSYHPHPGWAEQDASEWETALYQASRKAMAKADVNPTDILGISADATIATIVPVDQQGSPLSRAIMWMDVRADKEYEELIRIDHPALQKFPTAEWAPCKLMWLKKNLPKVFKQAYTFLEYLDWINWKLTGRFSHALSNLSARWMFDRSSGGFPTDLLKEIDLIELPDKIHGPILAPGEVIGKLKPKPAAKMDLIPGIPVIEGAPDAMAASIGVNALEAGDIMMIMGSSHCHLLTLNKEMYVNGIMGPFTDCPINGKNLLEAGQTSTGSILRWLRNLQGQADNEAFYSDMDSVAADLPVGSEGLILLDYFQGNRTPLRDPSARGAILGLSLTHQAEHLYRAVLEGVAYGTERILERFRTREIPISRLIACGGGATSELWLRIHANVSNIEIDIPTELDASLLGCAILGAAGQGIYPSPVRAASQMVRYAETVGPNPTEVNKYQFYFDRYTRTYQQNREILKDLTAKRPKDTF